MSTTGNKRVTVKSKAPKAATAKKPKDPKEKKAKSASHPPYFHMIKEAILALHERTGSSPYAIAKHMEEKHKGTLPGNFRKLLAIQLRNLAANGKLSKVKASFKLSEPGKQAEKKAAKGVKPKVAPKVKKPKTSAKVSKPTSASISAPIKRKAPKTVKKPAPVEKSAKKKPLSKKVKFSAPAKPKQPKPKQPKSIKSPAAKRAKKAAA
ncbi:histone H1-like [Phalaenopsis equestris]|uniref:histone H1-like n=1 Tax=Phalaenopsis equestris TaxID=78828 RepID=UPI0009E3A663|nr:histone H1-like [Phalaenopsis equestris]